MNKTTGRSGFNRYTTCLLLAAICAWILFGLLGFMIQDSHLTGSETALLWQVHYFRYPMLTTLSMDMAYMGGMPAFLLVTGITSLFSYYRNRKDFTVFIGLASFGAMLLGWLFKEMIARPRPLVWEQVAPYFGWSFPSNHSVYAITLAGIGILLSTKGFWRVITIIVGMLWSVSMGLSRIYLGAHFPTDVLAGWSLGMAWLCLLSWYFMYFDLFQHRASTLAGNHEVKL